MGPRRKRFGQHFLEPVWVDKVLKAIDPRPEDLFLEIGPGAGALTLKLAPRVARLTAVEIDRDLIADLKPRLPTDVSLIEGDILEVDLQSVDRTRVAGNLPFNVSSKILFRLLELQSRRPVKDATL